MKFGSLLWVALALNFKIPRRDQTRLHYGVFAAVLRRLLQSRRRLIAVAARSYLDIKFRSAIFDSRHSRSRIAVRLAMEFCLSLRAVRA